jgi:predicted transposase YbfD/YdcC
LAERIEILFAHAKTRQGQQMERSEYTTVEKGHGRVETRCCTALTTSDWGFYLDPQDRWEGLCSIVRVEATRQTTDETSTSVRYFISSLGADAARALGAIREHWGIENRLHWVLDIAFREDESRIRKGHGAHNFGLLRRLALIQLKRESTLKVGIANKRQRAGWDNAYLAKVLAA